ncbi:CLUMA_CG011318, isoform A [Clunio marinus]|uniref:CLUMA_CG011318, isoform A n=1 Tax=Clunio marinus TaxID=568069 RepID=A0A1J1IHL6_9DIPT|nr:CLUMA_CG011318, isoform A [Clunio marinus]
MKTIDFFTKATDSGTNDSGYAIFMTEIKNPLKVTFPMLFKKKKESLKLWFLIEKEKHKKVFKRTFLCEFPYNC